MPQTAFKQLGVPVLEALKTAFEAKNLNLICIGNDLYSVYCPSGSLQFTTDVSACNPAELLYFEASWMHEKPELIAAAVAYKLNLCRRIFARKCSVKRMGNAEAIAFLNQHHFLGGLKSAYPFGLFYNTTCVAVALFSKGRKMNRLPAALRSYELLRYASHKDVQISGGLSKLLHHFTALKNPGDIMTYVDTRYFSGKAFKALGFKEYPSAITHNLKLVCPAPITV